MAELGVMTRCSKAMHRGEPRLREEEQRSPRSLLPLDGSNHAEPELRTPQIRLWLRTLGQIEPAALRHTTVS